MKGNRGMEGRCCNVETRIDGPWHTIQCRNSEDAGGHGRS